MLENKIKANFFINCLRYSLSFSVQYGSRLLGYNGTFHLVNQRGFSLYNED